MKINNSFSLQIHLFSVNCTDNQRLCGIIRRRKKGMPVTINPRASAKIDGDDVNYTTTTTMTTISGEETLPSLEPRRAGESWETILIQLALSLFFTILLACLFPCCK